MCKLGLQKSKHFGLFVICVQRLETIPSSTKKYSPDFVPKILWGFQTLRVCPNARMTIQAFKSYWLKVTLSSRNHGINLLSQKIRYPLKTTGWNVICFFWFFLGGDMCIFAGVNHRFSAANPCHAKSPTYQAITAGIQFQNSIGMWKPQRQSIDIPQRNNKKSVILGLKTGENMWKHMRKASLQVHT